MQRAKDRTWKTKRQPKPVSSRTSKKRPLNPHGNQAASSSGRLEVMPWTSKALIPRAGRSSEMATASQWWKPDRKRASRPAEYRKASAPLRDRAWAVQPCVSQRGQVLARDLAQLVLVYVPRPPLRTCLLLGPGGSHLRSCLQERLGRFRWSVAAGRGATSGRGDGRIGFISRTCESLAVGSPRPGPPRRGVVLVALFTGCEARCSRVWEAPGSTVG